ncbi:ParA family protein [Caenispirillum salinarum]|uniref:ParA family protein n=1 Tax=Caenispirillum salinarum TaxID=859058 RepID=UPI00384C9A36
MSRVISVVSSKGGACKTTTAVCLAAEAARRGQRVVVIDADGPQHHATEWLRGGVNLRAIDVVIGPSSLPAAVQSGIERYDTVIIDIMGADTATLSLAVANADLVIIPATNSPLDVDGVERTVARLRQVEAELAAKGIAGPIVHRVLLSRTEPETTLYRLIKTRLTENALPLFDAEIRRRVVYQEAAFVGSAPPYMADARAAAECAALYDEAVAVLTTVAAEVA